MAQRILVALALALVQASASEAGGQAASGGLDPAVVRVLLYEGAGPVRVERPGAAIELSAAAGGVRGGRGPVRASWRSERGPFRVVGLEVRGALLALPMGQGLALINEVPLEDYVAATLGREVYSSWHDATLRAQAVAIRSYVLHQQDAQRRARRPFDVVGSTTSQVYGGIDAESEAVWRAVRDTRGEILTFGRVPILAAYHSASGGRTASAEEVWGEPVPYLRSLPVEEEEDSPDTYWRARVARTTLRRSLAELGVDVGAVRSVEVAARGPSGRVRSVRVRGARGERVLTGRELRSAVGEDVLRSTLFEIRAPADARELVFVGSGSGHGVGMSQWGAQAMASQGRSHAEILARFYPGARLEHLGGTRSASAAGAVSAAAGAVSEAGAASAAGSAVGSAVGSAKGRGR